jgi:hypothetical protein
LIASEFDLKSPQYQVLGWCNFISGKDEMKYILLQNQGTKELKKYPLFYELQEHSYPEYRGRNNYSPASFTVDVMTTFKVTPNTIYKFSTKEESDNFLHDLKIIKNRALTAGQIYL